LLLAFLCFLLMPFPGASQEASVKPGINDRFTDEELDVYYNLFCCVEISNYGGQIYF